MRLFWALIALLAAATAAVFALREGSAPAPSPAAPPAASAARRAGAPEPTPPAAPATDPAQAQDSTPPAPRVQPEPDPAPEIPQPAPEAPPPAELTADTLNQILGIAEPGSLGAPQPAGEGSPTPEEPAPDPAGSPAPEALEPAPGEPLPESPALPATAPSGEDAPSTAAPGTPALPPAGPAPGAPPAPAPSPDAAAMFQGYEVLPAVKVVGDDGTLRLDDRFVLAGKGTEADPYRLTWELLISAQETLVPRSGKKKIPERLTMLEGQWVEITGNIAFPLLEEQPDELLCMLNAWDGCCIGVPPTPYDAIEVRLKRPITGPERFASYASLRGKFFIKPYLVGEWLVGLYVMDNAEMTPKQAGAEAP